METDSMYADTLNELVRNLSFVFLPTVETWVRDMSLRLRDECDGVTSTKI